MIKLLRTDSQNKDFIYLVSRLDAYLAEVDGEEHAFYNQLNKIDKLNYVVVAYVDNKPVGCGAIREHTPGIMEVKRMYTLEDQRGKGVATKILNELEKWTVEMFCDKCVLETGKRQPGAVEFYKKRDYTIIPSYGQYANIDNSVCFQKELN
ncbi:MAG TPA: GNAT family N-acetyltransferase [Chitinophagaceae bacterium]|nr:GNAT family N-acetyltransferase [Chitinophagaceae bacterium]